MPARTPGAIHTAERSDRSARRMRRDPTYAEKQLWKALRQIEQHHFRRQAPFGPYVVDFVCHASRLIVEVDGGIHNLDVVAQRDAEREAWLVDRGYRVIRFSNLQALETDVTLATILAEIGADTPTPNPSPQGGGGLD
ncbi:MAG TPA: DUF559 domain-containing protein [Caulobacteraceae bacterium]